MKYFNYNADVYVISSAYISVGKVEAAGIYKMVDHLI